MEKLEPTGKPSMIFDHEAAKFRSLQNTVVLDMADLIEQGGLEFPTDAKMCIASINAKDIPRTMIGAATRLGERYPGCYMTIAGAPRHLGEVVAANTGVKLIAVATLVEDEVADIESWKQSYAAQALEAGCDGVFIDFDPSKDLAPRFLDRVFLS